MVIGDSIPGSTSQPENIRWGSLAFGEELDLASVGGSSVDWWVNTYLQVQPAFISRIVAADAVWFQMGTNTVSDEENALYKSRMTFLVNATRSFHPGIEIGLMQSPLFSGGIALPFNERIRAQAVWDGELCAELGLVCGPDLMDLTDAQYFLPDWLHLNSAGHTEIYRRLVAAPEPASSLLLAAGIIALGGMKRAKASVTLDDREVPTTKE